jgi:hypothetical protein
MNENCSVAAGERMYSEAMRKIAERRHLVYLHVSLSCMLRFMLRAFVLFILCHFMINNTLRNDSCLMFTMHNKKYRWYALRWNTSPRLNARAEQQDHMMHNSNGYTTQCRLDQLPSPERRNIVQMPYSLARARRRDLNRIRVSLTRAITRVMAFVHARESISKTPIPQAQGGRSLHHVLAVREGKWPLR